MWSARLDGVRASVTLFAAFVLRVAEDVVEVNPDEVVHADTIGVGTRSRCGKPVESGAAVLEASVGGPGDCPDAPRATGEIATEDLMYLLHGVGHETGVDLEALIGVAAWLSESCPRSRRKIFRDGFAKWETSRDGPPTFDLEPETLALQSRAGGWAYLRPQATRTAISEEGGCLTPSGRARRRRAGSRAA